ncbi:hypothetical protein [Paraferrimonas sp. SM1919]|uniref:hypothetical protein n=1 Tax=Paraferrimonas sp. SM1919 TaxID=2662263 RepID=UPI0013D30946|nr:hypothetical protein [Paraferrimonas sp. SM1919]
MSNNKSIVYSERGILARYISSTSTHQRHQAKVLSLLDWIYRFGFTSTAVLEDLWELDRSVINRLLRRYCKEEVIEEMATFACRDKRIFLLKPKGIRMLEAFHNESLKYKVKRSTINFKTITHDLMVQSIVATGVNSGRYAFFYTESEQDKDAMGNRRRFDALVFDGSQMLGVEVEASSKTIPSRKDILKRYQQAIESKKVDSILLFSHRRRFIADAERIHNKLYDKSENQLDRTFFEKHIRYVYSKETIAHLYGKFWAH